MKEFNKEYIKKLKEIFDFEKLKEIDGYYEFKKQVDEQIEAVEKMNKIIKKFKGKI